MTHQPRLMEEPAKYAVERAEERAEYLERLREKLQYPEFRAIEGFPIGEDEVILELSDPPYYTACPNPFLPEIISRWHDERRHLRQRLGLTDDDSRGNSNGYEREPFSADVSEGKRDSIYQAHSYYTKVPHKAIMRYILHYTDPGDIVFDGFCGTGMTGVAATLCGDKQAVAELGYQVDEDGLIREGETPISRLGVRKAILVDLSPAATFISYNYNVPINIGRFEREAKRILRDVEKDCGWMYETWHPSSDHPQRRKVRIDYTVWSAVFFCPQCSEEIVFFEEAFDSETERVKKEFACPRCSVQLTKRDLKHHYVTEYDPVIDQMIKMPKRIPVRIGYKIGRQTREKPLDSFDFELLARIKDMHPPEGFVSDKLPFMHMTHQRARMDKYGVTHLHHFFLPRARHALGTVWAQTKNITDPRVRAFMLFNVEQAIWGMSLLNRYTPTHYSHVNQYLSGVYYISSLIAEVSPWYILEGKIKRVARAFKRMRIEPRSTAIATQSAAILPAVENSVDYIFTDPPFGENIYYADLNYLVESWHKVRTNSEPEAIIDQAKQKDLYDYQDLMRQAFRSYYRWLKPGRWMTVEFHNSHNVVWNAIQEALASAGFIVADVRVLDKKQSSYRQVTATSAAKQDLAISAYKPRSGFERQFETQAGSEAGAWGFVEEHLRHLPMPQIDKGRLEVLAERQAYLLYDRMVAFHIQRGLTVPLSAAEFYAGLAERFSERDDMYFLPQQATEYDKLRLQAQEIEQLPLIVTNEKNAILWLRQELKEEPQTYQELQPKFLRELHQSRYEELPELSEILEQNFLQDDQARWYVPDPNRAQDLEKLREKALLREFREYLDGRGRLKTFRSEAIRAGFRDAWHRRDYQTIVKVAERLPDRVLQEDPDLLMYYDNARLRTED